MHIIHIEIGCVGWMLGWRVDTYRVIILLYIYVLGVSILSIYKIFLFNFGTVFRHCGILFCF